MLFMVIETFRDQNAKAVYQRLKETGRQMPAGLHFVHSHVAADLSRCWQVMECNDVTLLQQWIAEWSDIMAFEVVPVCEGRMTNAALGYA